MRLLICALVVCTSCTADVSELELRARGYRGFEQVNTRSFRTAQHQGTPLVNVWTDPQATAPYRALSLGAIGDFPEGSMIVKEMLDVEGTASVLTVMAKQAAGYDPLHGDWWYGRFEVDGATEGRFVGRVAFCIACHQAAMGGDYLFGVSPDNLARLAP